MDFISIFILGLLIGSFLNVCIYRLPQNESIVFPPSHCMSCGNELKALDLVPVLSYFVLQGKCRFCKTSISPRYAGVEVLTGFLFLFTYYNLGLGLELLKALIFISFLVVITFIDYDHQLILDKVLLPMGIVGVLINLLFEYSDFIVTLGSLSFSLLVNPLDWLSMGIGFFVGGGLLFIIAMVSGGGMGGGDIKFAAVLGLWLGWQMNLLVLMLAFILGGIVGVLLIATRIKSRKDYIPFGPFIAISAWIVYIYGIEILQWYFSLT